MGVAIRKTKAELGLADLYQGARRYLPGGEEITAVRAAAFDRFDAVGLPHRRVEAWRYTDLRTQMKEAKRLASLPDDAAKTKAREASNLFAGAGFRKLVIVDGAFVPELSDLADLEAARFGRHPALRRFRHGHPCWRKITDPLLLSEAGKEMVVLDPDLYFPNRFSFEPTAARGVMLMWQRPSCLLPDEVVTSAITAGVALAHHTDIGVAQWRQPVDLDWLNWLIATLEAPTLPRHMHIESIVWAAIAMKIGGGYLDPGQWVCWHRTQYKRLLRRLGVSGAAVLQRERFSGIKCFHAGGEAKW
ncbi:MAG: hypothetical protein E6575_26050, partial [Bradyrhizobium sp.]|nr:hypothetical protein [Bradyrhizobium sp.]